MTDISTEKSTEKEARNPKKSRRVKRSILVAPLLVLCCFLLSGYVAFSYMAIPENNGLEEGVGEEEGEAGNTGSATDNDSGEALPEGATIIGQYTAVSGSEDAGRMENIRLAAEALNGLIIEPGEILSFNEIIGNVDTDDRYQDAPLVNSDGIGYGRGGGICQVSSTLYLAALYADLYIVERHPHSSVVDYTPIGLDATVAYDALDLKIKNNKDTAITIEAFSEGQSITVNIIGTPHEEGVFQEPISQLIEYHAAGTPLSNEVEWDADLVDTTFYIVESYLEYYSHGNKTETVFLSRDLYKVFGGISVRMPDGSVDSSK